MSMTIHIITCLENMTRCSSIETAVNEYTIVLRVKYLEPHMTMVMADIVSQYFAFLPFSSEEAVIIWPPYSIAFNFHLPSHWKLVIFNNNDLNALGFTNNPKDIAKV